MKQSGKYMRMTPAYCRKLLSDSEKESPNVPVTGYTFHFEAGKGVDCSAISDEVKAMGFDIHNPRKKPPIFDFVILGNRDHTFVEEMDALFDKLCLPLPDIAYIGVTPTLTHPKD